MISAQDRGLVICARGLASRSSSVNWRPLDAIFCVQGLTILPSLISVQTDSISIHLQSYIQEIWCKVWCPPGVLSRSSSVRHLCQQAVHHCRASSSTSTCLCRRQPAIHRVQTRPWTCRWCCWSYASLRCWYQKMDVNGPAKAQRWQNWTHCDRNEATAVES